VQREIVARTDLADLRSHSKTWDILRRTKMPAVRVDVGYLTNPGDAARLTDPSFRDVVAEAIVVAVQRVYLDADSDAKTGVLRFSELREALARRQS
jgi:N-acetylmuramoyl-L-alanine amidase